MHLWAPNLSSFPFMNGLPSSPPASSHAVLNRNPPAPQNVSLTIADVSFPLLTHGTSHVQEEQYSARPRS